MRGALMAGFFASASVGSVLGVMLGGIIAAHWGWQAAFGVVGFPGLAIALLYLFVRDYRTVELTPKLDKATRSARGRVPRTSCKRAGAARAPCCGCASARAAQLIVVSAVWSWLPSFLNRVHGVAPAAGRASRRRSWCCAARVGSVAWGALIDRAGRTRPRGKLRHGRATVPGDHARCWGCAFGRPASGWRSRRGRSSRLIAAGGFLMTCTVGPVPAS